MTCSSALFFTHIFVFHSFSAFSGFNWEIFFIQFSLFSYQIIYTSFFDFFTGCLGMWNVHL